MHTPGSKQDSGMAPRAGVARLDEATAQALLAARGVTDPLQQRHLVALAGGHPRALALAAEAALARPEVDLTWAARPDLAQALLGELLPDIPDELHREALWCSAILLRTSEELVARLVDARSARALFGWLSGLPGMRVDAGGLHPDDLVRGLLEADLTWRRPGHKRELLTRVAEHYVALLQREPSQRLAAIRAVWFAWREELRYFQPDMLHASVSPPRPHDFPVLEAMVQRHFGAASCASFRAWALSDRGGVRVFVARDAAGEPCGVAVHLPLGQIAAADALADPGTAPLYQALSPEARDGAMYMRFFVDREHGQHASPTAAAISAYSMERALSTAGVTSVYSAWTPPEFGLEAMGRGATEAVPEAAFELDGRTFGVVRTTVGGARLVDWFIERYVEPLAGVPPVGKRLSPRERDTLALLLQGKTEKEVAAELALSTHTVHQYVKSLYRQYGVTTRGGLVARAMKERQP